ncbi:MAG TPA: metallophosphoesterase [bacterium]|nr:metallophosphoesterase [bacterium]
MKTPRITILFIILLAACCAQAGAREADGRLGLIRRPISTQPEFVQQGEKLLLELDSRKFDAGTGALRISLVRNGANVSIDNALVSGGATDETYFFVANVPAGTATGGYDVSVTRGSISDTSRRAVVVMSEYPKEYRIIHITDIHVGRVLEGAPIGERNFDRMKDVINGVRPDMVILTGDLSDTSDPSEFKKFIDIVERIEAPTFAIAGNHDRNYDDAASFIGSSRYDFLFGSHFYLGFDTQYMFPDPDPSGQMAWIRKEVRANQTAPFKVLFSHRPDSDFRFVISKVMIPMKVNLLLLGHTHEDAVEKVGALPSVVATTPAELDGYYRIITIKNNAIAEMKLEKISP